MATIHEFRKIISSPIIMVLLLLFIGVNLFYIHEKTTVTEGMNELNQIIDKHGTLMDEEGRNGLYKSYQDNLKRWNTISEKKTGKTYESASEFFANENYNSVIDSGIYSKSEHEFVDDLMVTEIYLNAANGIIQKYQSFDLLAYAEQQIKQYGLSGEAAQTVREQYKTLDPRFEQIKENNEHLHIFFFGQIFRTHTTLFQSLFGLVLFESMILVVLFTAFLAHYEYDNRTYLITFATKRGRGLMWDKLKASLYTSILLTGILQLVTFGVYFLAFDYSRLWNLPISTGYLTEPNQTPFISWWNLTFIEYFLLGCGLIFLIQILFTLMTYVLSKWIKNSYVVFILFGVLFGMGMIVPGKMPLDSNAALYANFNPFVLSLSSKKWWMESGVFTTFKYYELITMVIWLSLVILTLWMTMKRFYRKDL